LAEIKDKHQDQSTPHKIWNLLTAEERRRVLLLMLLMLVGMLLEMLGIGLIIPAISFMTQENFIAQYPQLSPFIELLGNPNQETLIIGGMIALVSVYAIKAGFIALLINWQQCFIFEVRAGLSRRLYHGYMHSSYTFHMERNSAQLIRNIVNETSMFAKSGLSAGMTLLTEIPILLGIITLLLIFEPLGAFIIMSIFGIAGWGFHYLTKGRILSWGEARQHHEGLRIQHLQQGFGGVKDVKLLGREPEFLNNYEHHNVGSAHVAKNQAVVQQLPRLFLEFLAVLGLVALVFSILLQGKPLDTLLPILGLFAAAAFRVIPSINRIISAIQSLRYASPVVDLLNKELSSQESEKSNENECNNGAFKTELRLEKVRYKYPSSDKLALVDVSLEIPFGSSVGFIGGSGAGKSTLVDIILGLLTPASGEVKVDGLSIQTNLRAWQDQIGYVPQTIFLTDDTLRRNVALGVPDEGIDDGKLRQALKAAQLDLFVNDLFDGVNTMVGECGVRLSGGQRQRIGIARALYHDPQVLVLDEATSSLDTSTEQEVMNAVCELKGEKTLIIIAHRLSTVERCDHLFKIDQGELVEKGDAAVILAVNR